MVCFDFLEQCRSASGALVRAMQCSQAGTAPFLSLTLKLYFISFHFLRGEGQRIELPLDLRENRLRQRTWHKPMLQLRESLGIPKFRNDVTRLKGEERGYATNEPGGEGLYLLCLGTKEMNRGVRNHSLQDRSHPPENPMVGSYSYGYEKPGKVTASGKVPAGSSREGVTAKGLLDWKGPKLSPETVRSFGFPHKQARAKLSFERVSEQQSQARSFPALDLEAMDRDSSLPQYSIGKQGRRTQIAANVECIMKGLEILSPPIKS
ncbi:hypothetical protein V6N13_053603 [Hibiscus sabdariffa]